MGTFGNTFGLMGDMSSYLPLTIVRVVIPPGGAEFSMWWDDPSIIFSEYSIAEWGDGDGYTAFLSTLGNFEVDYGDGVIDLVNWNNDNLGATHSFIEGEYLIKIKSPYAILSSEFIVDIIMTKNLKSITTQGNTNITSIPALTGAYLTNINADNCTNLINIPDISNHKLLKNIELNGTNITKSKLNQIVSTLESVSIFPELDILHLRTINTTPDRAIMLAFKESRGDVNFSYTPNHILIDNESEVLIQRAHGTCQHNNIFYIGTRTVPSKLFSFNNPDDLTDYDTAIVTGRMNIETMVYDEINNRIYANTYNDGENSLTVLSINPANIADYSVVYQSSAINAGASPTFSTDGIYLYGITYTSPGVIFKLRISDWTLISQNTILGHNIFHSSKLQTYNDRSEIYAFNSDYITLATPVFVKINCDTLNYEIMELSGMGYFSDEFALKPIDNDGSIVYAAAEHSSNLVVINTKLMTYVVHPSINSYGTFLFNNDLYILGGSFEVIKYKNCLFDINNTFVNRTTNNLNELFMSIDNRFFATQWSSPYPLIEFRIDET